MNNILEKIKAEIISDQEKEKLILIDDIFRVGKMLVGFDFNEYLEFVTKPGDTFDWLCEFSMEDLEVRLAYMSALMSQKARELAGFLNGQKNQ